MRSSLPLRTSLTAALALVLGLLVLGSRLAVESQWFAQFGAASVLWRRWLLQLLAFVVVMGLGVPLQLQQLSRCWRLRQEAPRKTLPQNPLLVLGQRGLLGINLCTRAITQTNPLTDWCFERSASSQTCESST